MTLYWLYRMIMFTTGVAAALVWAGIMLMISSGAADSSSDNVEQAVILLTIFNFFSWAVLIFGMVATNPMITDGEETLDMRSPLSHPALRWAAVFQLMAIVLDSSSASLNEFLASRVHDAASATVVLGFLAILMLLVNFYSAKRIAGANKKNGVENTPFRILSLTKIIEES